MKRCNWAKDELDIEYHDKEWGVPVKDDATLFEFLILEGAQAGLSWITVLRKRENYRKVFLNYNLNKLVKLTDKELDEICKNESIIRNRLKVYSVRSNAIAFKEVQKEFKSFSNYIWSFTQGKVIDNRFKKESEVPAETDLSRKISKDLKKRGFKFVGPTIVYAYLQAVGIVNDHIVGCCAR